ncbi:MULTISPECIES: nucleoside triphosphate pyrophosphohydrolase family protein [unclassified Siphonobacter]|uniref:nucleoside triphosphate pyrophosphohydrolase family protein n=1 Tax=unclassified Siphonobacter TaxID=2635712 RepID=UPI000CC47958|nr:MULTISPECIES: nucleoside triphosphate pyrophosphohydrolase family protein [unclassified Siphonobacter]MDQ1089075.1 putative HAD superfamily Cof-like phosphohydrolase [Siphonobacter sp. SORGH_AS_1065]MDR6195250.1 putative HAD superfamily Cof-like phosphohydrolase [Siphonobacter sp. SORGH_AS_0500]PKK38293.1 hypothetical protein BWI96_00415 [Siphonobacter sp. SORGH_AS_0500]
MDQLNSLQQVAEFHHTFHAPVLSDPQIPSENRSKLRYALLAEELKEFQEAVEANDLIGVADALCDLQYVLSGAVLEFGLGEKFVDLFNEVHRSNMSKACSTEAEAQATVAFYLAKDGTEASYHEDNGKWLVYRKSDHKTLKSVNYSPADLASILQS